MFTMFLQDFASIASRTFAKRSGDYCNVTPAIDFGFKTRDSKQAAIYSSQLVNYSESWVDSNTEFRLK